MQTTVNWAKLLEKDRCKDIGVSWSEEDLNAIHNLGIPAAYVRDGVVSLEAYSKVLDKESREGRPLRRKSIKELASIAEKLGIQVLPDMPKQSLLNRIEIIQKQREIKKEQAEALRKTIEGIDNDLLEQKAKKEIKKEEKKQEIKSKKEDKPKKKK